MRGIAQPRRALPAERRPPALAPCGLKLGTARAGCLPCLPSHVPTLAPRRPPPPAQVEGSADRAVLRSMGIAVGGLLAVAVGSNGRLLNNPYFFTGMILLGNALFRCVPG